MVKFVVLLEDCGEVVVFLGGGEIVVKLWC